MGHKMTDSVKNINESEIKEQIDLRIPRIEIDSLSYSEFFEEYIQSNKPCIISDITKKWPANSEWVDHCENVPNFKNLNNIYGDALVPVVDCNFDSDQNCCKRTILFSEFISYWENRRKENGLSLVSYLKDWHLRKQRPSDPFYTVPEYFTSDWLNEYSLDNDIDDYMFVYMGPKGSWTPFHADVFKSFSWSANVVGKKRWLLFPPGEEKQFLDPFGNFPSDIQKHLNNNIVFYEVIQNTGEGIFVPSGWYHQVFNEEDTISINHNWVNSCNIEVMWKSLIDNLNSVEDEIKEFNNTDGWSEHCQLMLQALFGMNINDFANFIKHIADKRLHSIETGTSVSFGQETYRHDHILRDLKIINDILNSIIIEISRRHLQNYDLKSIYKRIEDINKLLK